MTNNKALRVLLGGHSLELHSAAEEGRTTKVVKLLQAGHPVAGRDAWGRTPLHCATSEDALGAVQALLDAGAPVNAADADGFTPLHVAGLLGRRAVAACLLAAGADQTLCTLPTSKAEPAAATPLLLAVSAGHASVAEELIATCLDAAAADGATALRLATEAFNVQLARLLLRAGVHPDAPAAAGAMQPLLMACSTKGSAVADDDRSAVVVALLEAGADVGLIGATGFTPLAAAARAGHVTIVSLLLRAGADANQPTSGGMTPLRLACANKREQIVQLLLAAGALGVV